MSFNVMSLVSGLAVDGNGLDLFTMQSAKYEQITTKFTLTVKGVSAGPGVRNSAANRLIGEVVQSRRRPLLGPSPG